MDMFSLDAFDNTNDFAGMSGSSIFKSISTLVPTSTQTGEGKSLNSWEETMSKLNAGKPALAATASMDPITGAINAVKKALPDTPWFLDAGRMATILLGMTFVIIGIGSIAFAHAPTMQAINLIGKIGATSTKHKV